MAVLYIAHHQALRMRRKPSYAPQCLSIPTEIGCPRLRLLNFALRQTSLVDAVTMLFPVMPLMNTGFTKNSANLLPVHMLLVVQWSAHSRDRTSAMSRNTTQEATPWACQRKLASGSPLLAPVVVTRAHALTGMDLSTACQHTIHIIVKHSAVLWFVLETKECVVFQASVLMAASPHTPTSVLLKVWLALATRAPTQRAAPSMMQSRRRVLLSASEGQNTAR